MVQKLLNGNTWKVIVLFLGSGIFITFGGILWKASAMCSKVEAHERAVVQVPLNTLAINDLKKDIGFLSIQMDKSEKKQDEIIAGQIQILKELKN
jgi:hypothetical protein